jgi:hypothetical protein
VSAALPSLVTIPVATWLRIHDSAHSSLLTQPWLCVNVMAKDGEGTPWLHPFLRRRLDKVADAMIKAPVCTMKGSVAKLPFGGRIRKWDLEKSMTWEPQLSCFR